MKKRWFNFAFFFIVITSCIKTGSVQNNDACIADAGTRPVSYTTDIKPIITQQCLKCHGIVVNNGASETLITQTQVNNQFAIIKDQINRPLTDTKHMPVGFILDSCDKFKIEKWETDGFLN